MPMTHELSPDGILACGLLVISPTKIRLYQASVANVKNSNLWDGRKLAYDYMATKAAADGFTNREILEASSMIPAKWGKMEKRETP